MRNIIDYAAEQADKFQNRRFNAVDSLILAQLSYLNFDGFVPGMPVNEKPVSIAEIAQRENIDSLFRNVRDGDSNRRLFKAVASSPRFRDTRLTFYVNKIDFQPSSSFQPLRFCWTTERCI